MFVLQLFSLWTSSSMQMIMTPFALLIRSLLPRDKKDKPFTIWLLTFSQSLANVWAATSPYLIRYYPMSATPIPHNYVQQQLWWVIYENQPSVSTLSPMPSLKPQGSGLLLHATTAPYHLKWEFLALGHPSSTLLQQKIIAKENNQDRWFMQLINKTFEKNQAQ